MLESGRGGELGDGGDLAGEGICCKMSAEILGSETGVRRLQGEEK